VEAISSLVDVLFRGFEYRILLNSFSVVFISFILADLVYVRMRFSLKIVGFKSKMHSLVIWDRQGGSIYRKPSASVCCMYDVTIVSQLPMLVKASIF